MASSLFQNNNNSNNDMLNMVQQFNQFKQIIAGKDPNAMLQQMIDSGNVTSDQLNQAKRKAETFRNLLH